MSVAVCLAPMIPANCAMVRTSPFFVGMEATDDGDEEGTMRSKARGERKTVPTAVADRRVLALGETETIDALPVL